MKNLKYIFFLLFIYLLNINILYSETPHFIDFKYILNESNAGKKAQNTLKSKLENDIKKIKT